MENHTRTSLAALAAVALATSACGLLGASGGPPEAMLGAWQLVEGRSSDGPIAPPDDHRITLQVSEDGQVGGTSACNDYGGEAEIGGGAFRLPEVAGTAMACVDQDVMDVEARYTAALQEVRSYATGDAALTLTGPGVELVYERLPEAPVEAVVGTAWVLETVADGDMAFVPAGDEATLRLTEDGVIEGSTGCRGFTGEWRTVGDEIVTPTLSADGLECPPDLTEQDGRVFTVIGDGFQAQVDGDLLTLTDGPLSLVYRAR